MLHGTSTVDLEFAFEKYPKSLQEEWRSWSWSGTTIFIGNDSYPAEWIKQGYATFNRQSVSVHLPIRSLVREKIEIGVPRKGHVGQLLFEHCQDFLLHTDFGRRRTIECKAVGLIAEDHYDRISRTFYPVIRIVGTQKFTWNHPAPEDVSKPLSHREELIEKVKQMENGADLVGICGIDFVDILRAQQ